MGRVQQQMQDGLPFPPAVPSSWQHVVTTLLASLLFSLLVLLAMKLTIRPYRPPGAGYVHNRRMSADTVSPVFPDRPIRPLPKRRLRERLSPEVADSIQYPPEPQSTTPLFYYPYNGSRDDESDPIVPVSREPISELDADHARANGLVIDSDDEELALSRRNVISRPIAAASARLNRPPAAADQARHPAAQLPPSAGSSVDGYDSFEHSNNNKKRKIPTAAESVLSAGHSMGDSGLGSGVVASVVQSCHTHSHGHDDSSLATSNPYYGSGNFASGSQGISGPGRGRYGRVRNGRSPLRALSDSTNNWAGRNGKLRPSQWSSSQTSENTGIISTAIANAEKVPVTQGQENVSLLQQQSVKQRPTSSQFTFTCDSQVPGSLTWPGPPERKPAVSMNQTSAARAYEGQAQASHGTQTYPTPPTANGIPSSSSNGPGQDNLGKPGAGASQQSGLPPQQPRQSLTKKLHIQASDRKKQTRSKHMRSPPKEEDFWICHFCEYEAIFGAPPKALIRRYELKEHEAAERRRRVERNKQRSRKGKKGKAPPAKANPPHTDGSSAVPPNSNSQSQSDEYFHDEEDYDDEEDDYGSDDLHHHHHHHHEGHVHGDATLRPSHAHTAQVHHPPLRDPGGQRLGQTASS